MAIETCDVCGCIPGIQNTDAYRQSVLILLCAILDALQTIAENTTPS